LTLFLKEKIKENKVISPNGIFIGKTSGTAEALMRQQKGVRL